MWVLFSSGTGPKECEHACLNLALKFVDESFPFDLVVIEIDSDSTGLSGCRSMLISVEGDRAEEYVKSWEGTIKWICESPFRANWKRKNWFISVSAIRPPTTTQEIHSSDLKIDTFRSSGPGGQNLQKTDSAVRITHLPTGSTTQAQEERSQTRNKSLAMARMVELLESIASKENKAIDKDKWMKHNTLERGNPVRIYEGKGFKLKKAN